MIRNDKLENYINSFIAKGAHERPLVKLFWQELGNFAAQWFPKASRVAMESWLFPLFIPILGFPAEYISGQHELRTFLISKQVLNISRLPLWKSIFVHSGFRAGEERRRKPASAFLVYCWRRCSPEGVDGRRPSIERRCEPAVWFYKGSGLRFRHRLSKCCDERRKWCFYWFSKTTVDPNT